jgi:hypothetical protein
VRPTLRLRLPSMYLISLLLSYFIKKEPSLLRRSLHSKCATLVLWWQN